MATGRFERSGDDGATWRPVEQWKMHVKLEDSSVDVDAALDRMVREGEQVHTSGAVYRFVRDDAGAVVIGYPG